jgi:hypothetical protein
MFTTELIKKIENTKVIFTKFILESENAVVLRTAIYNISTILSEHAPYVSDKIRLVGLQFNTSPIVPSLDLLQKCGLDNFDRVHCSWGEDVAFQCKLLSQALNNLEQTGSLLQAQLVQVLKSEVSLQNIKIWCHSQDRITYIDFLAKYGIELNNANFICSLKEYRLVGFFDLLVIVGPLRHFGWSCLPQNVVNAPRYRKMVQIIWRGLADSPEFGCDPIIPTVNYLNSWFDKEEKVVKDVHLFSMPELNILYGTFKEFDDLELYNEKIKKQDNAIDCYLITIKDSRGVLLSHGAENIFFDENDPITPFKYIKSRELEPGQFIVLHNVKADLGTEELLELKLSILWKNALNKMYIFQWETLMSKMHSGRINLKNLDHAASQWRTIDKQNIHAPQTREHFRILIEDVLPKGCLEGASWQQAWLEIESKRIRARQYGRLASEIANEELVKLLNKDSTKYQPNAYLNHSFSLDRSDELTGTIEFFNIVEIVKGFKASYEKLGIVDDIETFKLFRKEL